MLPKEKLVRFLAVWIQRIALLIYIKRHKKSLNSRTGAYMPSFDMVSEVDFHEVTNAIDQANRELKD